MTNTTPKSAYQDAFNTLKSNAELLENSQNIDIDSLMDIVESSISAYKTCQSRIDAVEQALKQSFDKLNIDEQNQ